MTSAEKLHMRYSAASTLAEVRSSDADEPSLGELQIVRVAIDDADRIEPECRANLAKILSCRIDPPTSLVYGAWHGKGRKKETKPRNTRVRALNR